MQGQEVVESTELRYDLFHASLATEEHTSRVSLYVCDLDEAPAYSDGQGAFKVGQIEATFDDGDIANAEKRWCHEDSCYLHKIDYTVVMQPLEGGILCKIEIDGVEKGRASINYF